MLKNKIDKATSFIKDITERTNKDLLLGLSGGIDSAVALALAIKAVGPKRIKVVMLPYKENSNLLDAVALANSYGVEFEIISIADIVEAFNCSDEYRKANMMARVRMTVLYDQAMKNNALVVGTTNLSEYYLGYFTKWGDGAVDLEPLMSMTKTEVFEIAKLLGLPSIFLSKKPSADLWEGQTDFDELQVSYDDIDLVINLYLNFNSGVPLYEFMKSFTGNIPVPRSSWNRILFLNEKSMHKLLEIPTTFHIKK